MASEFVGRVMFGPEDWFGYKIHSLVLSVSTCLQSTKGKSELE